jgi:hypothetical protein
MKLTCQKGQGQSNISCYFFSFIPIHCISFLESLNQMHRETRKQLRQQEQASEKISHQKNDKVHISILSIEKTKKKNENNLILCVLNLSIKT